MRTFLDQPFSTNEYGIVTMTVGDLASCLIAIAFILIVSYGWVRIKKQPGF